MAKDRYNEHELAMILRAAGAAQAKVTANSSGDAEYTVEEIASMASEVGIEARFIHAAADQLEQNRPRPKAPFGSATTELFDRNVDGIIGEEAWDDLVASIRAAFGSAGTVSKNGAIREWRSGGDFVFVHLTATERKGKTKIRLMLNRTGGLYFFWALGFAAMLVLSLLSVAWLKQLDIPVGSLFEGSFVAAMIFLCVRTGVARWGAKDSKVAVDVLDGLQSAALTQRQEWPSLLAQPDDALPDRLTESA